MKSEGEHVVCDVWLNTRIPANLYDVCRKAVLDSGMRIECEVRKEFDPWGDTIVFVLSESHFAVHTFPELNFMSIDCYTCSRNGKAMKVVQLINGELDIRDKLMKYINRG